MWWLTLVGFAVGTIGTLIGAGGGFILVPLLMWLYPQMSPEQITSVSLGVVFCNALSGTITYALKHKVDFRNGALFAALAVPGAVLGTYVNARLERSVFDPIFAVMLFVIAVAIWLRPSSTARTVSEPLTNGRRAIGAASSVFVGFLSSLLGIGGGIIHMPLLIFVLRYAVLSAVATSHFILCVTSFAGLLGHAFQPLVFWFAPGVVLGAQLGAWLAPRVPARRIAQGASFALLLVALRILLR